MNKLTDKELNKWLGILGKDIIEYLYYNNKISLSKQQLDKVIEIDNNKDKTMLEVLKICKLVRKVKRGE